MNVPSITYIHGEGEPGYYVGTALDELVAGESFDRYESENE